MGYYYSYSYFSSMIVLIPAILFTLFVQFNIKRTYNTYSRIGNSTGITGSQAARQMLDAFGLSAVPVNMLSGGSELTNYFDPRENTVNLSAEVFNSNSIASICIACHEVGHAMQYASGYAPIKIRNSLVPVVNLTNALAWPLILIGLVVTSRGSSSILILIGIICFLCVILFHTVTLPVEFNASNRALKEMQTIGIVNDADLQGSRKVLRAAAMTYVAALAAAVASLLRILLITRGRD